MHTAGADGLAEAVVCVVFVVREVFEPALDEAGRDRLRADVHEPPLVEQIVIEIDAPGFNGVQDILRPWNQQPDDGAFFFCDCTKNPLRLYAAQQHGLAPGNEASEPVHFRPCMIEWRNTKKHVLFCLPVVMLLGYAGTDKCLVPVQDCFWKAGRAGGKIDCCIVVFVQRDRRDA